LLDTKSLPPSLTKDVVRLSLWPKYNKDEVESCKESVLMKERVVSCTENLGEINMILLVQYKYPLDKLNDLYYKSTSRKFAEIVDLSKIGCVK